MAKKIGYTKFPVNQKFVVIEIDLPKFLSVEEAEYVWPNKLVLQMLSLLLNQRVCGKTSLLSKKSVCCGSRDFVFK